MRETLIQTVISALGTGSKRTGKNGVIGKQGKNRQHPDNSIVKISYNIWKSPKYLSKPRKNQKTISKYRMNEMN